MEHKRGIWYGIAAYVFWGMTPIYWNLVSANASLILLHRIIWSVPILMLVVTERRQWAKVRSSYSSWKPRVTSIAAAILLSINWGTYIWAVTSGHITEASLGYFINPLVSVALGVVVLGERLRPVQWTAVGIAAVGVAAMGVISGTPPWISLILAFSFGIYGLLKKRDVTPPPVISLFGETLVLFVPALVLLAFVGPSLEPAFNETPAISFFFVGGGLVTVFPLLLFGAAAKRIPLSTLGFLQFVAPVLQLVVGLIFYGESLDRAQLIGFGAVWIALALFGHDRREQARSERRESDV